MTMKRQNITPENMQGLFIYHDDRGRCIYSAPFMKGGYLITKTSIKTYSLYNARLMLSFVVAVIISYLFPIKTTLAIILGVGIYVATTLMFFFLFLPKLYKITNFEKPKKDNYYVLMAKNTTPMMIIGFIALTEALAALILFNCLANAYTGITRYLNIALSIVIAGFGLSCIYSLVLKKKIK